MKFEFQKIDVSYIQKRVLAEEESTGRRVVSVRLTPSEWREFLIEVDVNPYQRLPLSLRKYTVLLPTKTCARFHDSGPAAEPIFRTVEVSPDST